MKNAPVLVDGFAFQRSNNLMEYIIIVNAAFLKRISHTWKKKYKLQHLPIHPPPPLKHTYTRTHRRLEQKKKDIIMLMRLILPPPPPSFLYCPSPRTKCIQIIKYPFDCLLHPFLSFKFLPFEKLTVSQCFFDSSLFPLTFLLCALTSLSISYLVKLYNSFFFDVLTEKNKENKSLRSRCHRQVMLRESFKRVHS